MGILSFFSKAFKTKQGAIPDLIIQMQNAIVATAEQKSGFPLEQEIIDTIRQQKSLLMLEAILRTVESADAEKMISELKSLKNDKPSTT
jgi:hypothetical protein